MSAQSIVVLSDLHANATALRRAIAQAAEQPVSHWIVLGDLLTYGVDVAETLELVADLCARRGAVVLRGTHDQLYRDLAAGDRTYYDTLPAWIRESADATLAQLDVGAFTTGLPWCDEHVIGDVLFSHATPFGAGDWRYLRSPADLEAALRVLGDRGYRLGVFGHVHRHRSAARVDAGPARFEHDDVVVGPGECMVVTAGSVGQPRDDGQPASFVRIDGDANAATYHVRRVPVAYDVQAHVARISASTLTEPTKARLASFFR